VLDALLALDEQAEYHNLALDHIRLADLIVINKVVIADAADVETVARSAAAHNPGAVVHRMRSAVSIAFTGPLPSAT